jgi:hypothetical protein
VCGVAIVLATMLSSMLARSAAGGAARSFASKASKPAAAKAAAPAAAAKASDASHEPPVKLFGIPQRYANATYTAASKSKSLDKV